MSKRPTSAEYVAAPKRTCPACGHKYFEDLDTYWGDRDIYVFMQCDECSHRWEEIFTLSGYQDVAHFKEAE